MMSSKRAASGALIELLELAGEAAITGVEIVFKTYSQMRLKHISRSGYHKKLKKFEDRGLIKAVSTDSGRVFVITQKAKLLRRAATTKKLRGDGFSTLVIFDIPEDKHNARDTLRRYLVRNGYTQMQKSSFLSPFIISDDLKELISELKLQSNVQFFSVKLDRVF